MIKEILYICPVRPLTKHVKHHKVSDYVDNYLYSLLFFFNVTIA